MHGGNLPFRAICVAAALVLLASLSGCSRPAGAPPAPSAAPAPSGGRIVSLSPGTTEIAFALGLGGTLVGVTTYCDFPPEAKAVEKVGDCISPSLEKVLSLRPTLVLGVHDQAPFAAQLSQHGVPVYLSNATSLDALLGEMGDIARLGGAGPGGDSVVAALRRRVDSVRARTRLVPEAQRPRVFVEVWDEPLMTAGPGTFTADVVSSAGGRPALELSLPWPVVDTEAVVAAAPDVVLLTHANRTLGDLRARPGWAAVPAVREGRVYALDPDAISRPGPRIADALEEAERRLAGARAGLAGARAEASGGDAGDS